MSPELSVITIVSSTVVSLGVFGGIVRWGISKYFEASSQLQNLKESNILSAIDGIKTDLTSLAEDHKILNNKVSVINNTVELLVRNASQSNQKQNLLIQSNFEALEAVKKTLDRFEELEAATRDIQNHDKHF